MAIYLGTATPSDYKLGSSAVSAIYLGSTLVWPDGGPPPPPSDSYFGYVALLLHADGTGGTFVDSSAMPTARTITAVGSATQSSTQSKFGGKSLYINTGFDYLTTQRLGLWLDFDFVIEAWVYPTSLQTYAPIIDLRQSAGTYANYLLGLYNISGTYRVDFVTAGGDSLRLTGTSTSVPLNAWTHIAVVRTSGVMRVYVNGTVDSTTKTYSSPLEPAAASNVYIGRALDGFYFPGYIDDLRVTNGTNRGYTGSTITVPSAAFPDTGTALTSKISVTRASGTSTFTGAGTILSPWYRASNLAFNNADGLSQYSFTASASGTAVVKFTYNDNDENGNQAVVKKGTSVIGYYDPGTRFVSVAVSAGDTLTISSSDLTYTSIEKVSVYAV